MEASRDGKRYAFVTACECEVAYLVVLERDGAHFRNDGTLDDMAKVIERLDGQDRWFEDENGPFPYRELGPAAP